MIHIELITFHHNDLRIGYFGIKNSSELIVQKDYLQTLCQNIKIDVKGCDIYSALKVGRHKLDGDLQCLRLSIY